MKFVVSKAEFSNLLNKLQNVVPQKPAIPVLSTILLEAANDELVLTATDLTLGMRCYTPAKVLEEGSVTLPAKILTQLLRELTVAYVEISINEHHIAEIVAGASRFKLHGMPGKEFPSLPDLSSAVSCPLQQQKFKEVLHRTAFAVSREDNRYVLTGVCMNIQDGIATFIGTDGKRLARALLSTSDMKDAAGNYIIPLKAIDEIFKNLQEEGEATLFLMNDRIAIELNQTLLVTKLLAGEYPDANKVIPEQVQTHVALHREELIALLRQVVLFTTNPTQSVRFTLSPGELQLAVNSMEIGEGNVSMPVNYQGAPMDIAFNPTFFLDILRHSDKESVMLGLTDSFNPGVITEEQESGALFLLMPMRLDED